MDIDKDAVPRPVPAVRRKRPSAVKCVIVICSLIGFFVFAVIVWFMGKGLHAWYDNARNPFKDLYLNATTIEAGTEAVAWPFIDKEEKFDVYFTVWARVPDAEAVGGAVDAQEAASRERYGTNFETVKKIAKVPERELLVDPVEKVVFSEMVFENVGMKDRNLHKDISFELPLDRFRDKVVLNGDVRGAVMLVPRSDLFDRVKEWTSWKPEGAKSLGRLDDQTAAFLGLSGMKRNVLDATSVSFGLIELHDKNYLNHTSDGSDEAGKDGESAEEHEYFKEEGWTEKEGKSMEERYKIWATQQPHFVSKSHVYILDETRPLNQTAFDEKHKHLRETSCGQFFMGMSLPACRWLCSRIPVIWENRLVIRDDESGANKTMYGPVVNVLKHMAGPKHLTPLPVRRNKPFDPSIDQKTVTVHHQITFSSFSPGRMHLLDNFVYPHTVDKNATEATIVQVHSDWEQLNGLFGNRAHGTHPRTRFLLGFLEGICLSLPIAILSLLYWYTRQTTAGLHSFSMTLIASTVFFEEIYFIYRGARSMTISWEMFLVAIAFSGMDMFEATMMTKLVLPFEMVWSGWIPTGVRRTGWTKRERNTRRLERKVSWVQRGAMLAVIAALLFTFNKYDLYLVRPLHRLPSEHDDMDLSPTLLLIIGSIKLTAKILQLLLNRDASTFAGQYALHAYLVITAQAVGMLRFWPWFVGRYEVRGGISFTTVLFILVEAATAWQALTLPRVEQVIKEDEEDE